MKDLEICKRIAEIEGVELFHSYSNIFDKKKLVAMYMDTGVKWVRAGESEESFFTKVYSSPSEYKGAIYNPLRDKALCFDLMVKHEIEVMFDDDTGECMTAFYFRKSEKHISPICEGDENPQRAICLAIIKKHEDK